MKEMKWSFWRKNFDDGEAKIEDASNPLLKISVGGKPVASLYHDGNDFCLTYNEYFFDTGLPPFNPEDFADKSEIETDKVYRSKKLWFVFAERLGALDRRDYATEMKKLGLNKNSDPLILLGKLSSISISKPWNLELVRKAP